MRLPLATAFALAALTGSPPPPSRTRSSTSRASPATRSTPPSPAAAPRSRSARHPVRRPGTAAIPARAADARARRGDRLQARRHPVHRRRPGGAHADADPGQGDGHQDHLDRRRHQGHERRDLQHPVRTTSRAASRRPRRWPSAIGGKGEVMAMMNSPAANVAQQRLQGFQRGDRQAPRHHVPRRPVQQQPDRQGRLDRHLDGRRPPRPRRHLHDHHEQHRGCRHRRARGGRHRQDQDRRLRHLRPDRAGHPHGHRHRRHRPIPVSGRPARRAR